MKSACAGALAWLQSVGMSGQSKVKAQSVDQKINESAPHGSVGYKLFSADTNTYYPVRAIQGREFFKLGKGLESPAGVPTGTYQIHYIDAGGKPIYLSPLPTVRIGRSGAYRNGPTDDSADSESENVEDESEEESGKATTSFDDTLATLIGAAGDVETKTKRHKLAGKMQKSKHIAETYELFDTMKSDMMRQILALSKISQKHNEIQLAITDKLKESLDKNIATAANPESTKEIWAPVASELLRTIGDLGRTAMSARSLQPADPQKPALPPRSEPDEVIRAATEAAEKSAQKAAEQMAQRAAESASAQAAQALAVAERAESKISALFDRLEQVLSTNRAAAPPSPAAPVVESVKAAPPPAAPVVESVKAAPPPAAPVVESATETPSPAAPVAESVEAAPPPAALVVDSATATPPPAAPVVEATPRTSSERTSDSDRPNEPPSPAAVAGESAPSGPPSPDPGAAARSAALALRSQDPHVQSWRAIKRFVRRMTDLDLLVFTSSVPMFLGFLSMLRALTPYYKGPSMSLDELSAAGAGP